MDSLEDLFFELLKETYDAENQLIDALPRLADKASTPRLKDLFEEHLEQTRRQKQRLEEIFRKLGKDVESQTSIGMKAMVEDGEVIMKAQGDPMVKDAAMIAASQCVEHVEIASYGTLRSWAQQLGWMDIADILQTTLDEEKQTDKRLTVEAESEVNVQARR